MRHSPAALLREARTDAGLSRRGLAGRAGVPTSTVSRIENGHSDPTVAMLDRLIQAAGAQLTIDVTPHRGDPTLASLATALDRSADRLKIDWTRLRGFADWAGRHRDDLPAALADAPARTGTVLDPILAAFAEQLAIEHELAPPRWTRALGPLPREWSPPGTPRMLAAARATTPEPFHRRNLVLGRSALFRQAA